MRNFFYLLLAGTVILFLTGSEEFLHGSSNTVAGYFFLFVAVVILQKAGEFLNRKEI